MKNYHFKKFCRKFGKSQLLDFFRRHAAELQTCLAKHESCEAAANELYQSYLELNPEKRTALDRIASQIDALAAQDATGNTIHDLARRIESAHLQALNEMALPDRVLYCHLHLPAVWHELLVWHEADMRLRQRWYHCRLREISPEHDCMEPDGTVINTLEHDVSQYVFRMEGRGQFCKCLHSVRGEPAEECYIFTLSHYPQVTEQWKDDGSWYMANYHGSFEIALVYDREEHSVRVRALGDKSFKHTIATIWARIVKHAQIENGDTPVFRIESFREFSNALETSNIPMLTYAFCTQVAFRVWKRRGSTRVFTEADGNVAENIRRELNRDEVPLSAMNVYRVCIRLVFMSHYNIPPQNIMVYTNHCNLESLPEHVRPQVMNALRILENRIMTDCELRKNDGFSDNRENEVRVFSEHLGSVRPEWDNAEISEMAPCWRNAGLFRPCRVSQYVACPCGAEHVEPLLPPPRECDAVIPSGFPDDDGVCHIRCHLSGKRYAFRKDELTVWTLNPSAFAALLRKLLPLSGEFSEILPDSLWELGNFRREEDSLLFRIFATPVLNSANSDSLRNALPTAKHPVMLAANPVPDSLCRKYMMEDAMPVISLPRILSVCEENWCFSLADFKAFLPEPKSAAAFKKTACLPAATRCGGHGNSNAVALEKELREYVHSLYSGYCNSMARGLEFRMPKPPTTRWLAECIGCGKSTISRILELNLAPEKRSNVSIAALWEACCDLKQLVRYGRLKFAKR